MNKIRRPTAGTYTRPYWNKKLVETATGLEVNPVYIIYFANSCHSSNLFQNTRNDIRNTAVCNFFIELIPAHELRSTFWKHSHHVKLMRTFNLFTYMLKTPVCLHLVQKQNHCEARWLPEAMWKWSWRLGTSTRLKFRKLTTINKTTVPRKKEETSNYGGRENRSSE